MCWMNTVGPYHNRQETYKYFSLPFCKGPQKSIGHHHETMGEALQGVELEFSGLQVAFKGAGGLMVWCVWEGVYMDKPRSAPVAPGEGNLCPGCGLVLWFH